MRRARGLAMTRIAMLLFLTFGGCAAVIEQLGRTGSTTPARAEDSWVWHGAGCPDDRRMVYDQRETDDERAHTLLGSEWPGFPSGADLSRDLQTRNARLDDRRFDAFTVGVMVLTCARVCTASDRIDLGMTAALADVLDREAVRRSVEHLAWSADAKTFYVDRVLEAATKLVA